MGSRFGERRYKAPMGDWLGEGGEWRRELAGAVILGLFMGVMGPFGTFVNGGLSIRIAYWVPTCVVGLVLYSVGVRAALHWGAKWRQPIWFVLPLACLVVSAPMSLVTSQAVLALWPKVRGHMRTFDWYGQAVVMSLPLSAAILWTRRAIPVRRIAAVPVANDTDRAFLDRLAPRLGRNLLCLQMEDHYVRAHTDRGSDLVLLPLKAALAELDVDGLQVHRSWWVARAAVTAVVQDGRNLKLKLSNGLEAPVSRASIPALRQAGWLEDIHSPESNRRSPSNQKVKGGA